MPSVDLYYMPISAPCRVVEIVAEKIGVKINKHFVDLSKGEHLSAEHLKLNPLHKVPFMVDGDLKIGESRAIVMYLINQYSPGHSLYPADAKERARIDELLQYEIGTFYQALMKTIKPKLFGLSRDLDSEAEKELQAAFKYYNEKLERNGNNAFLASNNLSIADISLAVTMSYAQACEVSFADYKVFNAYLTRVANAIPQFAENQAKAVDGLSKWVQANQAKLK